MFSKSYIDGVLIKFLSTEIGLSLAYSTVYRLIEMYLFFFHAIALWHGFLYSPKDVLFIKFMARLYYLTAYYF